MSTDLQEILIIDGSSVEEAAVARLSRLQQKAQLSVSPLTQQAPSESQQPSVESMASNLPPVNAYQPKAELASTARKLPTFNSCLRHWVS